MRYRQFMACLVSMVFLLLLAAPLFADPTPAELLVGAWEWVSSRDAWTGEVYTPATAGFTSQFQFFADGTATRFQDESPLWTATWEFRTNGMDPFVFLYIWSSAHICEVTQTTLRLDQTFVDGPLSIYTRRQPVAVENRSWGSVKALFD